MEGLALLDSLVSDHGCSSCVSGSIGVGSGTPASSVMGASMDNNQVYDGTYLGTSNGLQQNFTVDATTFKPATGLTTKYQIGNPLTGNPMFPWSYDGTTIGPISGNVTLGAQQ
jgi:hypothetical protein